MLVLAPVLGVVFATKAAQPGLTRAVWIALAICVLAIVIGPVISVRGLGSLVAIEVLGVVFFGPIVLIAGFPVVLLWIALVRWIVWRGTPRSPGDVATVTSAKGRIFGSAAAWHPRVILVVLTGAVLASCAVFQLNAAKSPRYRLIENYSGECIEASGLFGAQFIAPGAAYWGVPRDEVMNVQLNGSDGRIVWVGAVQPEVNYFRIEPDLAVHLATLMDLEPGLPLETELYRPGCE